MKKIQQIPPYLEVIERVVEKALKDAGSDYEGLKNLKRSIIAYKQVEEPHRKLAFLPAER